MARVWVAGLAAALALTLLAGALLLSESGPSQMGGSGFRRACYADGVDADALFLATTLRRDVRDGELVTLVHPAGPYEMGVTVQGGHLALQGREGREPQDCVDEPVARRYHAYGDAIVTVSYRLPE